MLLKNLNQKRILFAESGIDRWHAPLVARAILCRIRHFETITINKFDVMVINRMAEVLLQGRRFPNPFNGSLATELSELEVNTASILMIFD